MEQFPTTPLNPIKTPVAASSAAKKTEVENSEQECRTPTSEEHKIPEVRRCPPAPRKPRGNAAFSCKRRRRRLMSERLEFLPRTVSEEELDGFFRSCYEIGNAKRKRSCEEL